MPFSTLTTWSEAALLLLLVDVVLTVSAAEVLWLLLRRPQGWSHWLANVMAGLSLALALRLGLSGAGLLWVAPCLALAGLAHGLDIVARRRMIGLFPPSTP
jgi:hypothetical protein